MKAISLWQPWATAISLHLKSIETRGWETKYRGQIAIHAALTKRNREQDWDLVEWWETGEMHVHDQVIFSAAGFRSWRDLPFGAVVATAQLVDVRTTNSLAFSKAPVVTPMEYRWGNYQEGRFGWILEDVKPLAKPIPARGFQQLWEWNL